MEGQLSRRTATLLSARDEEKEKGSMTNFESPETMETKLSRQYKGESLGAANLQWGRGRQACPGEGGAGGRPSGGNGRISLESF